MNSKELTYLLQHPETINNTQAKSLEKLSREFPYFQSIRPLLLKNLKNQESFRYNQELKITAAYTTNRSILFDFITSDLFKKESETSETIQKNRSDIIVVNPQEIKSLPRLNMSDEVTMNIQEAEEVLDPSLFTSRREESALKQVEMAEKAANNNPEEPLEKSKENNEEEKNKNTLLINKPLNFDKKETHSFGEWLKLTTLKPIGNKEKAEDVLEKKPEATPKKELQKKDKFELIDEFIANNPKIPPVTKNTSKRNLAKENKISNEELMTETLAKVYLAQKNFKKAIQAYNILILKNPEKSGFFADQIRAIKKLQENK